MCAGNKARDIGGGLKLFCGGGDGSRNVVGIILDKDFKKKVVEVEKVSDRFMSMMLDVDGRVINVIRAYRLEVGCQGDEKDVFWEERDRVMAKVTGAEIILVGIYFNRNVGEANGGVERVKGLFGMGKRNKEGEQFIDFAVTIHMIWQEQMHVPLKTRASDHI